MSVQHYMRPAVGGLVLIVLLTCAGCQSKAPPTIASGELDLRAWNFESQGDLYLHGPWLYYPGRLLKASDAGKKVAAPKKTFHVPGTWNRRRSAEGRKLGGMGFATFALKLKSLPGAKTPLAVRLNFMLTAYELSANGRIICRNGVVGRAKADSHPYYVPCTGLLPPPDAAGNINLLLRVSNFHHRRGGPRGHILLGAEPRMRALELRRVFVDVFLLATMIVVGLYHLLLFGRRRRQKEFLFFALLCFAMGLRTFSLEEMLLIRLFPGIPWELFIRIIFITAYLLPPLVFEFFRALFPEDFSRSAARVYFALSGLLVLSLLLPIRYASWGILLISPLILISVLHVCALLTRSIRRDRPLAGAQLLGLVLMLLFMINDMLHDLQIIKTGYYASLGMFIFISCQGFVLTLRYSRAFTAMEKMYKDLTDHQAAELELLELNQSKDRFLSIISHDLRGPFSGMYGNLRYLSKHGADLGRRELLETISKIEKAGAGVYRLIENLLEWARSRMGRMPFEPEKIGLREFLLENLDLFRGHLEEKEITAEIRVPENVNIFADRRMMGTVLRNVFSNAAKFTPRGGRIVVELNEAKTGAAQTEKIEILFTDTGIGMDDDAREKLFQIDSVQARPGTDGETGGGLGLMLSHELIEINGGTIAVESEPGTGTRVRLRVPR